MARRARRGRGAGMPRYALRIEYDGRPFAGWQRQAALPSVQGALEAAVGRLQPGGAAVSGAGRTDAGVHALAQVAHLDMARDWAPERLAAALNAHLRPDPVAVTAAARVAERLPRAVLGGGAAVPVPGGRAAGAAGGRARPGLAGRAGRSTSTRCGRRRRIWSGGTTSPRSARRCARPTARCARSTRWRSRRPRTPGASNTASGCGRAPSCTTRCAASSGTLERVGRRAPGRPERVAEALAARDRAACGPVAPPRGTLPRRGAVSIGPVRRRLRSGGPSRLSLGRVRGWNGSP